MTRLLFFSAVFFLLPVIAMAGIGQPEVFISMPDQGGATVCLMVVPDGSGPDLTEARILPGQVVDSTIEVEVRDPLGYPVADFPYEDIWLESQDGGLVACPSGTVADRATDALGRTTISRAARAGGWSLAPALVFVNGSSYTSPPSLDLVFNSPDLTGDLVVDLSDVQMFVMDYHAPTYHFRSDLYFDGKINLADIVPLSWAYGATCP